MPIEDVRKKVLVTGGGGFIGSRLVHALLDRGCSVKVLDIQRGLLKAEAHQKLEFLGMGRDHLHAGIADEDLVEQAVEDVDVIYHLAINWDGSTWRHELPLADLFDVNIRGALNLLETAKSCGVRHFLYASSEAVYGRTGTLIADEESVCKPELWEGDPGPAYGILKLTIEKLCLLYHYHRGLPATIFRIRVAFDDKEAQLLNGEKLRKVFSGDILELAEGNGRESIHVDEVAEAFLLATLNEGAYGQVLNLSNPTTYISDRELYQIVIRLTDSKSEIKSTANPKLLGPTLESIEKTQAILGWKPKKTRDDLKRAITSTIQSIAKTRSSGRND